MDPFDPTKIYELAPHFALLIALNFLGYGLKKIKWFPNGLIPMVLIVAGAAVFPFIYELTEITHTAYNPRLYAVVLGACLGGAAVGFHQLSKLLGAKYGNGDTKV